MDFCYEYHRGAFPWTGREQFFHFLDLKQTIIQSYLQFKEHQPHVLRSICVTRGILNHITQTPTVW